MISVITAPSQFVVSGRPFFRSYLSVLSHSFGSHERNVLKKSSGTDLKLTEYWSIKNDENFKTLLASHPEHCL